MKNSKNILFLLARSRIESVLFSRPEHLPEMPEELKVQGAAFVTLTSEGTLRGCVGSLAAHRPLWEDIRENGHNAAFHDFRFPPLTGEEYPLIHVEVSVLTPPEEVLFTDEDHLRSLIVPHVDGIIFTCDGYRATFLPQVWDQLPDFDQFFGHLARKAGVGDTPDFTRTEIQRYRVERYHE